MMELVGKTILDRYEVKRFIGRGCLTEVYEAYDSRYSLPVALKFLRSDLATDADFLRRFRREIAVLKPLRHTHIVGYHGFEQTRDRAFLIMEYISGADLAKLLEWQVSPMSWEHVLLILQATAAALHYAHKQGIHHGHVKPSNVLIKSNGQVLLSDFGLVRWAEAASGAPLDLGLAEYMAPEQCLKRESDQRTDIYALGLVMYELLTKERPFQGKSAQTSTSLGQPIWCEQISVQPPPLSAWSPSLPPGVEAAILKALAKDPNERQQSISEFFREMTGQELAAEYPPAPELARLLALPPPARTDQADQIGLKQAATRLLSFLASDSQGQKEPAQAAASVVEQTKPLEPVPISDAQPPIAQVAEQSVQVVPEAWPSPPTKEQIEKGKPRLAIAWTRQAEKDERVQALLKKAGAEFLQGRWDEVQAACAAILELSPEHIAAQVLASEASLAQQCQSLYERATDALSKGEKEQAMALAHQLLAMDETHQGARNLLRNLTD